MSAADDPLKLSWCSSFYTPGTYREDACAEQRQRRVDSKEFVMQREFAGGSRQFKVFESISHAFLYVQKQHPNNRHFHETIFKEHVQKPRFDIDISVLPQPDDVEDLLPVMNHTELLDRLLSEIKRTLGPEFDFSRDVSVYSSHGPTKKSYHVVLNGYHVPGNEEAQRFAELILDRLVFQASVAEQIFIKASIDMAVYKKFQNFRMLGSSKFSVDEEKRRVKDHAREYFAAGRLRTRDIGEKEEEFTRSLITHIDNKTSKFLDVNLIAAVEKTPEMLLREQMTELFKKSKKYYHCASGETVSIDPWIFSSTEIVAHLIDCFHLPFSLAEQSLHGHKVISSFAEDKSSSSALILLKSGRQGYFCRICQRTHEHENPFLILQPDFHSTAITDDSCSKCIVAITLKCRRNASESLRLCSMRKTSVTSVFTCLKAPHDAKVILTTK